MTGGLFLGDAAAAALSQFTGHFPDSQDQRNTARIRIKYQATSRFWLPFEFDGDPGDATATYGQAVVDRINFNRGRIKPSLSVDLTAGLELYKREKRSLRLQADVENLNNRLNVIDFGGLFSGNAIGPPRSYFLRLATTF